jgi:hypothetical protein
MDFGLERQQAAAAARKRNTPIIIMLDGAMHGEKLVKCRTW